MLVIVPRTGASGDMLLSALIDLGADERAISDFLRRELGVEIRTERVESHGIGARRLVVGASGKHYSPEEMKKIMEKSSLEPAAKEISLKALATLVEAEFRVHGKEPVHFHELAHIDTLVDLMGCALALEQLGEKEILLLPINAGKIYPAALDILTRHKIPFYSSTEKAELLTPTGAALISTFAKPVAGIPEMISESVGYGAGAHNLEGEPNVLRVIRGSAPDKRERIVVLETNLDDVSGEIIAYASERLFEEGARDVSLIPIIAKKGRPGVILRAICRAEDSGRLSRIIFEETGTLGVREMEITRHIASRSVIMEGDVRIKVGKIGGRIISEKPEFEDLKKVAKRTGKPAREIARGLRPGKKGN